LCIIYEAHEARCSFKAPGHFSILVTKLLVLREMKVRIFAIIKLDYGVMQGSVLSPHLFAVYVDDITNCLSFGQKPLIIMYADDLLHHRYVYCKSFWINASRS